jgi:hypothetical protein
MSTAIAKELLDENRTWLEPRFIDSASGKLIVAIQSDGYKFVG